MLLVDSNHENEESSTNKVAENKDDVGKEDQTRSKTPSITIQEKIKEETNESSPNPNDYHEVGRLLQFQVITGLSFIFFSESSC